MVKIYTDTALLKYPLMDINDTYFDEYVELKEIKDDGVEYMQKIDNATIEDVNTNSIKTPFGVTGKNDLSTGLKTVLNLIYMSKHEKPNSLDITECGQNALDAIFEIQERFGNKIQVYLGHKRVAECDKGNDRKYCLNDGEILPSIIKLSAKL